MPPAPPPPVVAARQVAELCKAATAEVGEDKAVQIANYLCPGNYAVSGSKEGCDAVEAKGKEFKARMTVRCVMGACVGRCATAVGKATVMAGLSAIAAGSTHTSCHEGPWQPRCA